jgi:hypothetical protein
VRTGTVDGGHEAPAIASEVLRYFRRSPRAADTLEGIARWRLLEERIRSCVEEVDHALSWLVAAGLLLKHVAPGSAPLFSLNHVRRADADRFLARRRAGDPHAVRT